MVSIDLGRAATIDEVVRVAARGEPVALSIGACEAVVAGHARLVGVLGEERPHYGINTGFGKLSQQWINAADLASLQRNLVRSHAAGVGPPLPAGVVRGMLFLLARSLSQGLSGARLELLELIAALLNAGVTPVVPETGSVGASGDLAPLAHAALVLIGEGEALLPDGRRVPGAEALAAAGLSPVELGPKEGLALINGTHLMAARAALCCGEFDALADAALLALAASIDAARATDTFLDSRVYEARNQPGPARVAADLRRLLADSQILPSHELNDSRVQDPYSFRAGPIVLGSAFEVAQSVRRAVEAELGAVTDNPLLFAATPAEPGAAVDAVDVVSAANFHGMPVALPCDTLAVAVAHVAGASERRVYHMLSGFDPEAQLPPFLAREPGLHSGLMIVQYSAAAACNEIIGLATPATVVNLSTSAGMEDYNSFGPRAAAKLDRAISLARSVVAIELLCAAEAVEHHRPLRSGSAIERVIAVIRERVPPLTVDRPPAPDIAAIEEMIAERAFDPLG